MAVLLLNWDFHKTGEDDPVYEAKAKAADGFAKKAGSDRIKISRTNWAIETNMGASALYDKFKEASLANVNSEKFRGRDRVNVVPLKKGYVGFTHKDTRKWLVDRLK